LTAAGVLGGYLVLGDASWIAPTPRLSQVPQSIL